MAILKFNPSYIREENGSSLSTIACNTYSNESLKVILEQHEQWLESKGVEGQEASFRKTRLHGANFAGKNLPAVDFTEADLTGVSFSGANLDKAIFNDAILEGVHLEGATLREAQLFRGNLKNASLRDAVCSKAELGGAILIEADLSYAQLTDANLNQANLERAILNETNFEDSKMVGVNLTGAIMHATKFQCAKLSKAIFVNADLSSANFYDAQCSSARFQEADLKETNLREANLADADLSLAKGLMAAQLTGSKLLGAKLPKAIARFEGLTLVAELSKRAKTLFMGILSGCLYCWVSMATTNDGSSRLVSLPIVDTNIPIELFNSIAPIILLVAYVWFNLYLQPLWDALTRLPSIFPDGSLLYEKVRTWLPIAIIHLYMPMMKKNPQTLSKLEVVISYILVWWLVPITLWTFFCVNLFQQGQGFIVVCQFSLFIIAVGCAITFRMLCERALLGNEPKHVNFK